MFKKDRVIWVRVMAMVGSFVLCSGHVIITTVITPPSPLSAATSLIITSPSFSFPGSWQCVILGDTSWQMSRTLTKHIATVLFFGFGLWSLWDAYNGDGESEELAEVEAELDADTKANGQTTKSSTDDDLKKKKRSFMTQFFSPIFLKAFSITFFGEWGDRIQLATIGLAAAENPLGVVLGGILGQALCQTAAVFGGKSLATQISERFIALLGGILFIVFGLQSFFSTVES